MSILIVNMKGDPSYRRSYKGYRSYDRAYEGAPFEISPCNRMVVPFCQGCGKELEEDWLSCPFCNQTKTVIALQTNTKLPWYSALFNYFVAIISIVLGLFLEFIFAKANYLSSNPNEICSGGECTDLSSLCMGLQLLFIIFGIYLLIATLNKRNL